MERPRWEGGPRTSRPAVGWQPIPRVALHHSCASRLTSKETAHHGSVQDCQYQKDSAIPPGAAMNCTMGCKLPPCTWHGAESEMSTSTKPWRQCQTNPKQWWPVYERQPQRCTLPLCMLTAGNLGRGSQVQKRIGGRDKEAWALVVTMPKKKKKEWRNICK